MFSQSVLVNKNESKQQYYKLGHLLPIMAANELLQSRQHQNTFRKFKDIVGISQEHFEALYEKLVWNFSEFVQVLPLQIQGPLYGILNQGLLRASKALQNYLQSGYEPDALYNYAIYSAALLLDVSRVVMQYKIIIADAEGIYLDEWRPFEGSLVGKGQFYKIYSTASVYQRLQQSLTILLAKQLMPDMGLHWIAGNPQVFADWLDALIGDERQGGRVALELAKVRREDFLLDANLPQVFVEMNEPIATQHGESFLTWLKNGLANNEIKVNTTDASVHVVNEGILVEHKIFKQFVDVYNAPVNMAVVVTQFGNMMGIVKQGGNVNFDRFFSVQPGARDTFSSGAFANSAAHKVREGIVVPTNLIYVQGNVPAVNQTLRAEQTRSYNTGLSSLPRSSLDFNPTNAARKS